ncbi:MAG: LysM peptidoglycan-binding domain-containing protein, partial [Lysinibacillus sp.]
MKKTALTLATAFILTTGFFASTGEAAEHTVQKGDTLWNLSERYNTPVNIIMAENNLSSTVIFPGDNISINENSLKKGDKSTYVVRQGDTLANIAEAYGVSVKQLVSWNKLASEDIIFAGDTLALNKESIDMAKITQVAYTKTKQVSGKQQNSASQVQQASASTQTEGNGTRTFTMEATAYTAYCTGCSGITANGTNLRANPSLKVVAVDPSVIPLGTKVWVEGYGEAIAADT